MTSQNLAFAQYAPARHPADPVAKDEKPVLRICFPLAGDAMGGSHVSLRGLLDRLDPDRYEILIVPERLDGRLASHYAGFRQIADPGAPARSFVAGHRFGPLQFLQTLPGLWRRIQFLKDHRIDIVHTNDGRSHASWALAAKLAGCRLVWHHRGAPSARGLRYLAPLMADQIVTVSAFALPGSRFGAARHAKVVHSPFDVTIDCDREAARARIVDELSLDPATLICGYFGTLIERKRPHQFIAAVAELARIADRPVAGLIFGEDADDTVPPKIESALSDLPPNALVEMMGYRTPGHEWLAGCDLLLVPAIEEPLGRTLVEGMLTRTPVVAADSGGNPEALADDCGVLCRGDDPVDMARKALELIEAPQRIADMTTHARRSAVERFSEMHHTRAIEAIYRDLCLR